MNDSEILKIDLYHGTSQIFFQSIKKYGLGGFAIHKHYNLYGLLEQLYDKFNSIYPNNEWWVCNSFLCRKMLNNEITNGNFNFRYGGTYLSPSLLTAKNYATLNKYGSELLSTFFAGYENLLSINKTSALEIFPLDHKLRDLTNKEPKPIVLKVSGIPLNWLKAETAESVEDQIRLIKNDETGIFSQQLNFETKRIIPIDHLSTVNLSD